MPDANIELFGLRDAASLTGFNVTNIRTAQPELGPAERGIDVLFDLDGRRLGAQHTVYHSDEGYTPGKRGSLARAKEEATAGATQAPFGMWGVFDYRAALWRRVAEKIAIARRHDNRGVVTETWLVISASLPRWGAAASTMMVADAVRPEELNDLCHVELAASEFECGLLVLHLDRKVFGWDRVSRWRVIADPEGQARAQHRERMSNLVFNEIPADFCRRTQ
jgi:hypothetical protein